MTSQPNVYKLGAYDIFDLLPDREQRRMGNFHVPSIINEFYEMKMPRKFYYELVLAIIFPFFSGVNENIIIKLPIEFIILVDNFLIESASVIHSVIGFEIEDMSVVEDRFVVNLIKNVCKFYTDRENVIESRDGDFYNNVAHDVIDIIKKPEYAYRLLAIENEEMIV